MDKQRKRKVTIAIALVLASHDCFAADPSRAEVERCFQDRVSQRGGGRYKCKEFFAFDSVGGVETRVFGDYA